MPAGALRRPAPSPQPPRTRVRAHQDPRGLRAGSVPLGPARSRPRRAAPSPAPSGSPRAAAHPSAGGPGCTAAAAAARCARRTGSAAATQAAAPGTAAPGPAAAAAAARFGLPDRNPDAPRASGTADAAGPGPSTTPGTHAPAPAGRGAAAPAPPAATGPSHRCSPSQSRWVTPHPCSSGPRAGWGAPGLLRPGAPPRPPAAPARQPAAGAEPCPAATPPVRSGASATGMPPAAGCRVRRAARPLCARRNRSPGRPLRGGTPRRRRPRRSAPAASRSQRCSRATPAEPGRAGPGIVAGAASQGRCAGGGQGGLQNNREASPRCNPRTPRRDRLNHFITKTFRMATGILIRESRCNKKDTVSLLPQVDCRVRSVWSVLWASKVPLDLRRQRHWLAVFCRETFPSWPFGWHGALAARGKSLFAESTCSGSLARSD